jgi:putative ABC transport system permease protein
VFDYENLDLTQRIYVNAIGRLRSTVTAEQAQAEVSQFARILEEKYPDTSSGWEFYVVPLREEDVGGVRLALLTLLAGVVFVLLIGCANVANLLLARAAEREREITIRRALGASRGRLIHQLLTESVVLSLAGGLAGFVLAFWATDLLATLGPQNIPRISEVRTDMTALLWMLAISMLAAILFGLAPAIETTKSDLNESLKEGSRNTGGSSSRRLRSSLVVVEVALAFVLLIGAGLLARSFFRLSEADQGYDPHNVLTAQISLPQLKYPDPVQRTSFYQQVLDRVRVLPGVRAAAVVNDIPTGGGDARAIVTIEGQSGLSPGELPRLAARTVSLGFFATMGIPFVHGRDFMESEVRRTFAPGVPPVFPVIINESMARTYWPNEESLGKRVALGLPPARTPFFPVIGVVKDVRHWVDSPAEPTIYLPNMAQNSMTLVVKAAGDPTRLVQAVRQGVLRVDAEQPLHDLATMQQRLADADPISQARFRTLLLVCFSTSAMLLAAIGIYGVVSYSASQRTREMGIRVALGAQARHVLGLMFLEGMRLVTTGLCLGFVGAIALTRVISQLLYGVTALDAETFVAVAAMLVSVAALAIYVPARRAARVDPMVALRHE